jgi:molybdenum cofactor synthesis domain-containing protein
VRAAVVTVSTSKAAGEGEDESGPALAELARSLDLEIAGADVVPDDAEAIAARLRHWADVGDCALVLTSGGTGFSPTDVTPEATRAVIEREAPGIAEAMRASSRAHTPHWMLSRAVAGIRGRTLIVNFPGNPRAIRETGGALSAALPHALSLLAGERPH